MQQSYHNNYSREVGMRKSVYILRNLTFKSYLEIVYFGNKKIKPYFCKCKIGIDLFIF